MRQEKQVGIQVARAIAALSIVYFHSWVSITRFPPDTAYPIPGLKSYGWHAVDLFFAISGYVICLVTSRGSFSRTSFLIKRVFRLYPLWLTMLMAFAATAWLWRGLQPRESFGFLLYSATLLPTHDLPFYDVGWSLQHEMAFYLMAAVVVPLFGIAGVAAFLTASTIAAHTIDMPWYLASLATHHAEFLAGVLAFLVRERAARFGFWLPAAIGFTLLSFLLLSINLPYLPIALFFLIVAFSNLNPAERSWWQKPATALGDASYSIYLIHPMVFLIASAIVSKFPSMPIWCEEPIRFGGIGLVVVLSLLSWKYFETPIIRFGNQVASYSPFKAVAAPRASA